MIQNTIGTLQRFRIRIYSNLFEEIIDIESTDEQAAVQEAIRRTRSQGQIEVKRLPRSAASTNPGSPDNYGVARHTG
jgi:hypothetical protein